MDQFEPIEKRHSGGCPSLDFETAESANLNPSF